MIRLGCINRSFAGFVGAALLGITILSSLATADDKSAVASTPQRVHLTAEQTAAVELLARSRPVKPAPLFIFTDPNKDPDDLSVLIVTKALQQRGFVDLRCVVATLGTREIRKTRAMFTRCVLDELKLGSAKVGVGVDYDIEVRDADGQINFKATERRRKDHQVFVQTPLLHDVDVDMDGLALLKRELMATEDHSAVLLINCGMADVAALLNDSPELVTQKVARVVIMGGVEPKLDERGYVVADKRAYNNSTHQASADSTYARLQELGLPLVVVTKEATYSAAVPRSFYDAMAATGHPVGVYLKDQQKQSLKHLWEGIHQGHLPPALTPRWFFGAFTDLDVGSPEGKVIFDRANIDADDFEFVWKQVSKFNLYDPFALLAATPGACDLVFRGHVPEGARSKVQIIGKGDLKEITLVRNLLSGLAVECLNPSVDR